MWASNLQYQLNTQSACLKKMKQPSSQPHINQAVTRAGKGLGYVHFTLVFRPLTPSASKDFKKKPIKHWKKKSFDVAAREEIG